MTGLTTSIQVDGVKEAIRHLNQCEPGFKKLFTANVKEIAKPVTDAMKNNYANSRFPSGTQRNWAQSGRALFPLDAAKAKRGVGVRVNTGRRGAALSIYQKNPGAAIFDIAGRANSNALGMAFDSKFGRSASRVIWPEFESKQTQFVAEIEKVVDDLMKETNKNLKVA
jgi:hypothetical protein